MQIISPKKNFLLVKILALIPARGNSKTIKMKNMQLINGKPLIHYTISSALKSKQIDRIVVSSENKKILNYCKKDIDIIKRPKNLAKDTTTTFDVLKHSIKYLQKNDRYFPDYVIILQPTSPLRNEKDIDKSIEEFKKNKRADCLVSVQNVPHNFEPFSQMRLNKKGFLENIIKQKHIKTRKQEKKITLARNGAAIYIIRKKNFNKFILGGNILPYNMPMIKSLDIDNKEDLMLCRLIFRNLKNYENQL